MKLGMTIAALALSAAPVFAQSTTMDHSGHDMSHMQATAGPTEPGQGAFAAIAEIVAMLEADPMTDWSTVDIDALRAHLVDMSNVTLYATATETDVDGGVRFDVQGAGEVAGSVQRMVLAHAGVMNGVNGWQLQAEASENGAALTVLADADELEKIRALGFFGIMALGMHHQAHHLMLATGASPHGG